MQRQKYPSAQLSSAPRPTHQARARSDDGKVPTRKIRRIATRPQATPLRIGESRPDLPEMEGAKVDARVGFLAWAAHLEGAEPGGDSVHGRRLLRPSDSMESSPTARRSRGWSDEKTRKEMATGRETSGRQRIELSHWCVRVFISSERGRACVAGPLTLGLMTWPM